MSKKEKVQGKKGPIREYGEALVFAVVLALLIRAFLIQSFVVPSPSMVPTLLEGDHILVNKYVYGFKVPFVSQRILSPWTPQRGDVIVFPFPQDPRVDYVKRCVAVGGDTVEVRDRVLLVNGVPAKDSSAWFDFATPPGLVEGRDRFGPVTVPPGKLFVMGDNRNNSFDSRFWGFVDDRTVKGKALVIFASMDFTRPWLMRPFGPRIPLLGPPRWGRIGRIIR